MTRALARQRLVALRARRGLPQEVLAGRMGFHEHRTLAAIEQGHRAVSPAELVLAADALGVTAEHLVDPLICLEGDGVFSWRGNGGASAMEAFEQRAGGWMALYRYLQCLRGGPTHATMIRMGISARSTERTAVAEGEAVARAWRLGDVPARALGRVLEDTSNTLVLQTNLPACVGGAVGRLGALQAVFLHPGSSARPQGETLGWAVFRLLTWSALTPPRIDAENGSDRRARIAAGFGRGLLVPTPAMNKALSFFPPPRLARNDSAWMRTLAERFEVSDSLMKRRLVELGVIPKARVSRIPNAPDAGNREGSPSPTMSPTMMAAVGWGLEQGRVSVRRCARVLGTTVEGLADVFRGHGMRVPFDL